MITTWILPKDVRGARYEVTVTNIPSIAIDRVDVERTVFSAQGDDAAEYVAFVDEFGVNELLTLLDSAGVEI